MHPPVVGAFPRTRRGRSPAAAPPSADDAAKKLADCWVANLGPGKKEWFDGHQAMEQALVRFGRFLNDREGQGRGDASGRLARYLLDARRFGESRM